jgi:hypothetical protein
MGIVGWGWGVASQPRCKEGTRRIIPETTSFARMAASHRASVAVSSRGDSEWNEKESLGTLAEPPAPVNSIPPSRASKRHGSIAGTQPIRLLSNNAVSS